MSNKKVNELVELVAKRLCELDGHIWGLTSIPMMHKNYFTKAKQILSHPDLALIDPINSASLKWTRLKAREDRGCDYYDCTRGIKAGESYYEEFQEPRMENPCYCLECASLWMAQKLGYVIPLAEAIKESKESDEQTNR